MTEHALAYFLNAASLAIIGFSLNLLLLRARHQSFYWPLAGALLAIALLICQPWLRDLPLTLRQLCLLLALPALYLLPPCLWLYVQGLTSSSPWQFRRVHAKHFALASFALLIAIAGALLPAQIRAGILGAGSEQMLAEASAGLRYFVYGLLIITFVLVLAWCVQAGYYLVAIYQQLRRYRAALRQIFASTERHELHWIAGLLAIVGIVWLLATLALLYDNLVGALEIAPAFKQGVILLLVWSLASWGLRQKPGFAQLDLTDRDTVAALDTLDSTLSTSPSDSKYQRSALHAELADSIAAKLHQAMVQDQLFLDASLSLPKLAKHVTTSPSYVSQTLNERLGLNFFDFINHYRVAVAKEQLKSTDATALEIAMNVGFNAKSSFYTAFKKETGMTPQQYRQHTAAPDSP
jgi:AraC-like DNA-binding protein